MSNECEIGVFHCVCSNFVFRDTTLYSRNHRQISLSPWCAMTIVFVHSAPFPNRQRTLQLSANGFCARALFLWVWRNAQRKFNCLARLAHKNHFTRIACQTLPPAPHTNTTQSTTLFDARLSFTITHTLIYGLTKRNVWFIFI